MPSKSKQFYQAFNLPIYTASVIPVLVGTSIAHYQRNIFAPVRFLLALFGLLFLQIAVNLANDYFDCKTGVDVHKKDSFIILVKNPKSILLFSLLFFLFGGVIGLYLDFTSRQHVILLIGFIGFVIAFFYSSPPLRLSYLGMGEPVTFLCFGPLAVMASEFVQSQQISSTSFWASIPIGFLVAAILLIHHFTQYEEDKRYQKNNPLVRWGKKKAALVFIYLILAAYLWIFFSLILGKIPLASIFTFITFPMAARIIFFTWKNKENQNIYQAKPLMIKLHFFTGLVVAIGFLFS
ncbi:MAG: 1,4-dihydroxy-2-naphthoate phytyltransferase [candidate division Zixibacteria bacterium RBG_16_40_9]|nr:MAG: 1,4-dihydroxy-2-naphthoate phytyltransferase [candidate division Zixibacteria bacterium RBG_16_40_9]